MSVGGAEGSISEQTLFTEEFLRDEMKLLSPHSLFGFCRRLVDLPQPNSGDLHV